MIMTMLVVTWLEVMLPELEQQHGAPYVEVWEEGLRALALWLRIQVEEDEVPYVEVWEEGLRALAMDL